MVVAGVEGGVGGTGREEGGEMQLGCKTMVIIIIFKNHLKSRSVSNKAEDEDQNQRFSSDIHVHAHDTIYIHASHTLRKEQI